VAVINHATKGDPVVAKLPWPQSNAYNVRDLTANGAQIDLDKPQTFAPLAIRVYQYDRKP